MHRVDHKSKQVAERRVHQACMVIDTEETTMVIEISEVKVALKNGLHGPRSLWANGHSGD